MNPDKRIVEAQVVRLTRMAHPTDQGKATSELEETLRSVLEAMITHGETKAQEELKRNGFDGLKSGKKIAKKLRQQYQRELHDLADTKTDRLYKTFQEHIRTKPRWIPGPVWRTMQRVILKHYV